MAASRRGTDNAGRDGRITTCARIWFENQITDRYHEQGQYDALRGFVGHGHIDEKEEFACAHGRGRERYSMRPCVFRRGVASAKVECCSPDSEDLGPGARL